MKKALILEAGVGNRLNELTKDTPKCLLSIGKSTILDFSLQALKDNGINEIIFVTGFAHEKLVNHIRCHWSNTFYFQFIFNDKYSTYNNIYSAYLAKEIWDDETILLNSDIIFHPDILSNLVLNTEDKSYLVIDDTKELIEEDMKVQITSSNEIKKISKHIANKGSFGEYIGMMSLKGLERVKFLESLEKNIKSKKFDLYYEDALDNILSKVKVYPCSTLGKLWTEVDTYEDYKHALEIANEIQKVSVK